VSSALIAAMQGGRHWREMTGEQQTFPTSDMGRERAFPTPS
jgi:hypothetical protein